MFYSNFEFILYIYTQYLVTSTLHLHKYKFKIYIIQYLHREIKVKKCQKSK